MTILATDSTSDAPPGAYETRERPGLGRNASRQRIPSIRSLGLLQLRA